MPQTKVHFIKETLGFYPVKTRLQQTWLALRGDQDVPATTYDLSSLQQLHPRVGLQLWRGKAPVPRRVIISNLVNRIPTPVEEGWSVKMNHIRDFRGGRLTYNSHNGTDFAIPIGSTVCTAAPGKVVAIKTEFNRGGLKIFIEHGQGLMTNYAHLARALVQVGDIVQRGQPIAISGYSGIDGLITFPFGVPHVHFNTWLNGQPIDPFAAEGEVSMWHSGNEPRPMPLDASALTYEPAVYQAPKVTTLIEACRNPGIKARLLAIPDLALQAAEALIESNYYPTRFSEKVQIYTQTYPRSPRLDLPFSREDFEGIVFLDELQNSIHG